MQANTLPPHNIDAEKNILGSILTDPNLLYEVADTITPDDFYQAQNRAIFAAMLELSQQGMTIDHITLQAKNEAIQFAHIIDIADAASDGSWRIADHAKLVQETAVRRRMIQAAGQVAQAGYNADGDLAEDLSAAEFAILAMRGSTASQGVSKPRAYTSEYIDHFLNLRQNPRDMVGLPTGFTDLDRLLNGLQAPHQYVLAARPGMGKSAIAVNIADHAALRLGKRVAFFSLEMSEKQLMARRVSAFTHIDSKRLQRPWELTQAEEQQVMGAVGRMSDAHLYIDASESQTPAAIRAKALRLQAEHGLDLIIIDHLHRMKPDRNLKRPDLEWGEMSWSLANLGKALDVPVLTLAQLNRGVESRQVKRPQLSDLRESGGIEENAFCVMFLYRDGYYDEVATQSDAELIIAKHREGETGSVKLFWKPENVSYRNVVRSVEL